MVVEIRHIPRATPLIEKVAPKETATSLEKRLSKVDYYNIYLCNKSFKKLNLETILSLEEESLVYCITVYKSYDIDLKNNILNIQGVGAFACTALSQTKNGNHKYIRMRPIDMQIALDHQWTTCVIEEKVKDKEEYYVTVYGREVSAYKLLLPRTKE